MNTLLTPTNPPTSSWGLNAVGDFNGDNKTDLVFKVTTNNAIRFWFMNGSRRMGVAAPSPDLLTGQAVRAAGDFNADTKLDLVLQTTSNGKIFIQRFGSAFKASGVDYVTNLGAVEITPPAGVGYPNAGLRVYGAADFNGDGRPDLVIQNINAAGAVSVWYMNNMVGTGSAAIPAGNQIVNVNDVVRGLDDMNGDTQPDLIIQNGAAISVKPRIGTTGFDFGPKQSFNPSSSGSAYWTIRNN